MTIILSKSTDRLSESTDRKLFILQNLLCYLQTFVTKNSPTSAICCRIASEVYTWNMTPLLKHYIHSNIQCKFVNNNGQLLRYDLSQLTVAVIFPGGVAVSAATTAIAGAIAAAATAAVSLAASFS